MARGRGRRPCLRFLWGVVSCILAGENLKQADFLDLEDRSQITSQIYLKIAKLGRLFAGIDCIYGSRLAGHATCLHFSSSGGHHGSGGSHAVLHLGIHLGGQPDL